MAASSLVRYLPRMIKSKDSFRVCELGCGPGLPSIAAASVFMEEKKGNMEVLATDLDPLAVEMVRKAADDQGFGKGVFRCGIFDLESRGELPPADLYVLSDVFETNSIAVHSAYHVAEAVKEGKQVWVFAQADRIQREAFLDELSTLTNQSLRWSSDLDLSKKLWLCDVDELRAIY